MNGIDRSSDKIYERVEQMLKLLAHISFGRFDVPVPVLPDSDAFADLFIGLEILVADLQEAREELEEEVRHRTEALEADILERKRVEARLRASEQTYRLLVETSPDPIALCDRDGRIRMVNTALRAVFRLDSQEEVVGETWLDFVADKDRERAADCARVYDTGGVRTAEITFKRGDGSEFIGETRCSAMRDPTGEAPGVQYVIHDLSERKQREHEQLRAEKIAALGTLAGGIAHDFNNTLAAITGCLSLVRRMVNDNPDADRLLNNATDAAFRATALTQQLLTFSKGGMPVKTGLDIGELIGRVADFCVRGSNVKCRVERTDDLWPIEADPGQMEQMLGNLVINAQQSMPDGGVVTVRAENTRARDPESPGEARRCVRIVVEDGGGGIPPENLSRIFDPYFSTKKGGSGLGLATAYSVAKKHDGFIACESVVGRGSKFMVYLPAASSAAVHEEKDAPVHTPGSGSVLVMDDEDLVRDVATSMLREAGYEVVAVASGNEALSVYKASLENGRKFSVVLLDLTVPGGDGGKVTMRKLLEVDPSARGIVVSGYSDDPVLANYRHYGFIGRLAKPYREQQLLSTIASAVEEKR